MSLLLSVWHLLPWWSWAALLLFAIVISAAGLWPVVWKLMRLIPWPVYAILAGAIAFALWLDQHDQLIAQRAKEGAVAERDAYWRGREEAANERYRKQLADLQTFIDGLRADQEKARARLARELELAKAERDRAKDELKKRSETNVTAEAVRMCSLTRGVIVQFNTGAGYANGLTVESAAAAAAAVGSGPLALDEPSGVTLDTFSAAIDGTHEALRSCRDQVTGWQRYYTDVIKPWVSGARETLNRCIPQGALP